MPTTFHLSLNVSNLERSLAFYRVLFGQGPAKCHADYAKFELAAPPVIFSLVPQPSLASGALSRLALRLADAEAVAAVKHRLEAAGIPTQVPPGLAVRNGSAVRCYVADPDLNYWEISAGADSGPPVELSPPTESTVPAAVAGPIVWEHFLAAPIGERIGHADNSVDEVRLTGTFNAALEESQRAALLREVQRVLRPGGKVVIHGMVGERTLESPALPGLAALVQRVPTAAEPLEALRQAGFGGLYFEKLSPITCLHVDGVPLSEMQLVGWRPGNGPSSSGRRVLYKGPLASVTGEDGNAYPRGKTVSVSEVAWQLLREGPAAGQFLFYPDESTS